MTTRPLQIRRAGFTLIELIAAMSLAIVITSLAVGVMSSGAFTSQRVVQSGDRASGWLIVGKQRAMRDQLPRGLRFYIQNHPDPTQQAAGARVCIEAQYLELPEPWIPNPTSDPSGSRLILAYTVDTTTNAINGRHAYFIGDTTTFNSTVSVGDLLSMLEFSPYPYRVTAINTTAQVNLSGTPTPAYELTLSDYPDLGPAGSPSATPPLATRVVMGFSFQPKAQPLFGEPILQLGGNGEFVIEMANLPSTPTPIPTCLNVNVNVDHFDIMFAPSGQVLFQTAGFQTLWVRQISPDGYVRPENFDNAGEQVVIAVYTKTGAIATMAVNPDVNDPFKFVRDGLNTGF